MNIQNFEIHLAALLRFTFLFESPIERAKVTRLLSLENTKKDFTFSRARDTRESQI